MTEDALSSPAMPDMPNMPETGATVTSVAPVSGAPRRGTHGDEEYTVTFDTDARFTLTATTVAEFRLYVGKHLAPLDLAALRGVDAHQRAIQAAARHLGARPRSTREIEEYLRGKGFLPEAIHAAVARLTERGYLDDAAFAKWYAENRAEFRPRGPNLLRQELRRKGIATETVDETLTAQAEETDVDAQALALARKRAEILVRGGYDAPTITRRLQGLLARRGYGYDVVRKVLRSLKETGMLTGDGDGDELDESEDD